MANGAPRILPQMQQQPGTLEQFIGALQQNLPQTLQQLGQERQQQISDQQQKNLRNILQQIGGGGPMGGSPLEEQLAPQQQDTTQEMLQSLSQMGVQQPSQTPQQLFSMMQQATPEGQNLQNMLQQMGVQPPQQQQSQTPVAQEAQQQYQQQQRELPQMQAAQPDPQTAENQPVLSQKQFTNLYRDLQDQPAQRLASIDKQLKALDYLDYSETLKDKERKELKNEKANLVKEQSTIDKNESKQKQQIEDQMNRGLKATRTLDKLRGVSKEIAQDREGVSGKAKTVGDWLAERAGEVKIPYLGKLPNLSTLKSSKTREFKALATNLFDTAKDIYGGNISNTEFKEFLAGIPDAFDSKETRDKIIDHLEETNQLLVKRGKIMDQIIQANDGKTPRNIGQLVDRYMAEDMQKAQNDFNSILQDIRE